MFFFRDGLFWMFAINDDFVFYFIKRAGFFKKMRLTINVNEEENLPKENGQNGMVEQEKKAKSLFCSLTER